MKNITEKIWSYLPLWIMVRFSSHFWVLSECGTDRHDFKFCSHCKMSVVPNILKEGTSKCWNCQRILCSFDDEPSGSRSGYFYTGTKANRTEFYLDHELHNHLIWRSLFLTPLIGLMLLATLFDFSLNGYAFGLDESLKSMRVSVSSYFGSNRLSVQFFGWFAMACMGALTLFSVILGKSWVRFTRSSIGKELGSLCVVPSLFLLMVFFSVLITKSATVPIWSNDFTEIMTKSEAVAYIDKKALVEVDMLIANGEWKKAAEMADSMWEFSNTLFWDIRKNTILKKAITDDFRNTRFFSNGVIGVFSDFELVSMLTIYLNSGKVSGNEIRNYCTSNFWRIITPSVMAQDYSKPLLEKCKNVQL